MTNIAPDHPDVHEMFRHGQGFSVQLGLNNSIVTIPVDQTTEETINYDTQTPGEIKCFGLKPGAVERYYQTSEYKSHYMRQLRETVINTPVLQTCSSPESGKKRLTYMHMWI